MGLGNCADLTIRQIVAGWQFKIEAQSLTESNLSTDSGLLRLRSSTRGMFSLIDWRMQPLLFVLVCMQRCEELSQKCRRLNYFSNDDGAIQLLINAFRGNSVLSSASIVGGDEVRPVLKQLSSLIEKIGPNIRGLDGPEDLVSIA